MSGKREQVQHRTAATGLAAPRPGAPELRASEQAHPARVLLDELSTLLEDERAALVRLDRLAIDGFAARKLELDEALTKTVAEHPLGVSEKELLERIRNAALDNQLLLAHARSCVQGVLSLLAPKNTPRYTAPGHTAPSAHSAPDAPPLALNMRR
jgi:hypothetical protein